MGAGMFMLRSKVMCDFCEGKRWVSIEADSIPPYHNMFGVDSGESPCPVCNAEALVPLDESDDSLDLPYWFAYAVGGLDGTFTVLRQRTENGDVRTVVVTRQVFDFWDWMRDPRVRDCPLCYGWGLTSLGGQIQDCLACGGQPIEARQGFKSLNSWWLIGRVEDGNFSNWIYIPYGQRWNSVQG